MASPQRLPSGDLNMIIYKIQNKNNCNEIYIGKTKNLKNRIYQHKSRAKRHCDKKCIIGLIILDSITLNL